MIDKLKVIQYTLRDTEKYLFGIIKNEWMKDHPHFAYNQKQVLQDGKETDQTTDSDEQSETSDTD